MRPQVIAHSRTPYHKEAAAIGAEYFTDVDDFCEEHPEVRQAGLRRARLSCDKAPAVISGPVELQLMLYVTALTVWM